MLPIYFSRKYGSNTKKTGTLEQWKTGTRTLGNPEYFLNEKKTS